MRGEGTPVVSRDSADWQRAKKRTLKRDQCRCQGCSANPSKNPGVDLQVHHIKPVDDGGTHDLQNLAVLCNKCHWRLHDRFDDRERLSPGLLEEYDPVTFGFPETRTPMDEMSDLEAEIIEILKENGPTQLKDIIEQTGYSRGWVQDRLEVLSIGKYVCRVSRGVYAYIPETEYRELLTREADETGRYSVSVWDPGEQVTLQEVVDDG